jgi:DNA replication and repair protein RecF
VYLKQISLSNFKNYEEIRLDFCDGINCIIGENGAGKTNLLDAIYYLSFSKSAFNAIDSQNIRHQESYFVVQGTFDIAEAQHHVLCGVQNGQKKTLRLDKNPYDKFSEHIGKFPVVLVAPQDQALIYEGSEERRRFFDSAISQIDAVYLVDLMQYTHYLKQRNLLLKQSFERSHWDKELFATYDNLLIPLAQKIYQRRKNFVEEISPFFQQHYQNLTSQREASCLIYSSDVENPDFEKNYYQSWEKDRILQRTNLGIHKDDFEFQINQFPLKKYGSQGQQKSFLIALKLAQFDLIFHHKAQKPILLLDDIFDKLDERRMNKLIEMVANHNFGQIFLTDARPERSRTILEKIDAEKCFFIVEQGSANLG